MLLSLILTMPVVQQESESKCAFPNNCYSQFTEDEMYSIQLQMTELGEPEHRMHKCPHPASNVRQTLSCFFSKFSIVHELVLRSITWQWEVILSYSY